LAPGGYDPKGGAHHRRRHDEDVRFESVEKTINERIDNEYRSKYRTSPYLEAMIGERAKSATAKILFRSNSASKGA
jgi:hypothetical protein